MKKYLISTLALSSILVFGACSELEESEEEEVPEESEGTAEAEEEEEQEEQPLSPEELAEEVFGDELLQNEYNEDENILSVDVDFGDPWLYGRAQSNAESDMTELLEELAALDPVPAASFDFIGEVEDIEGNESEDSALLYEFESETVSSIDYEEFDSDELQETADHYWSHEEEVEAEEERLEEEEAEAERLEEEQAAEEERLEQEEAEEAEAESDLPVINENAKDFSYDIMLDYEMVQDAHIEVDEEDGTISLALIVGAATDEEYAKDLADSFARSLASGAGIYGENDIESPSNEYLGELYDHYDLIVGVATSTEEMIVQGAKVTGSPHITF